MGVLRKAQFKAGNAKFISEINKVKLISLIRESDGVSRVELAEISRRHPLQQGQEDGQRQGPQQDGGRRRHSSRDVRPPGGRHGCDIPHPQRRRQFGP